MNKPSPDEILAELQRTYPELTALVPVPDGYEIQPPLISYDWENPETGWIETRFRPNPKHREILIVQTPDGAIGAFFPVLASIKTLGELMKEREYTTT